jgi:hypothetical protein
MAGNASPIYSRIGAIGLNAGATLGTTIVSDYNGTGTNNAKVFTADATNGGFVQRLRFKALGTNATGAVARIYINNGSVNTSAVNNTFYGEMSLPTTAASTSVGTSDIDYTMNLALPPGYQIWVGISSSAVLGAGWAVTTIAGAY